MANKIGHYQKLAEVLDDTQVPGARVTGVLQRHLHWWLMILALVMMTGYRSITTRSARHTLQALALVAAVVLVMLALGIRDQLRVTIPLLSMLCCYGMITASADRARFLLLSSLALLLHLHATALDSDGSLELVHNVPGWALSDDDVHELDTLLQGLEGYTLIPSIRFPASRMDTSTMLGSTGEHLPIRDFSRNIIPMGWSSRHPFFVERIRLTGRASWYDLITSKNTLFFGNYSEQHAAKSRERVQHYLALYDSFYGRTHRFEPVFQRGHIHFFRLRATEADRGSPAQPSQAIQATSQDPVAGASR